MKTSKLFLAAIFVLATACQSGPFSDCKSMSLNKSKKPAPTYATSNISDKDIEGYISTQAKIEYAGDSTKSAVKVSVLSGSKQAGSSTWIDAKNISCKK